MFKSRSRRISFHSQHFHGSERDESGHEMEQKFDDEKEDHIADTIKSMMQKTNLEHNANMQQAFLHLDEDRSGYIDRDKLKKTIMHHFNMEIPGHIIDRALLRCGANPEGHISYDDFCKLFT